MSNVRCVYLYRDGANCKSWGEVVFRNPEELDLEEIEERLLAAFLQDRLFISSQIMLPEKFLFLNDKVTKYDHCFHEFDHVENCFEESTDALNRSIANFLLDVEEATKQGWEAFDILDRI